jgi:hypothetical protein
VDLDYSSRRSCSSSFSRVCVSLFFSLLASLRKSFVPPQKERNGQKKTETTHAEEKERPAVVFCGDKLNARNQSGSGKATDTSQRALKK